MSQILDDTVTQRKNRQQTIMKKLKEFYRSNKKFSLAFLAMALIGCVLETGNVLFDWYADKSMVGYYFAGAMAVIYFGAYLYEKHIK